jgi:hypothetical protein
VVAGFGAGFGAGFFCESMYRPSAAKSTPDRSGSAGVAGALRAIESAVPVRAGAGVGAGVGRGQAWFQGVVLSSLVLVVVVLRHEQVAVLV